MKLTEITASEWACLLGGCPGIFVTDRGSYILIGKRVDPRVFPGTRVGNDEYAVEIPKDLLEKTLVPVIQKNK